MNTSAVIPPVISTQPTLTGVRTAGEALGLTGMQLLHAGPPLADPGDPPPVLKSAAVLTALHEGWADSEAAAERLIHDGSIRWSPAQDSACVTPLAAVVAPSTPLFVVGAADTELSASYAPVSPVRGIDTRMGNRDPGVLKTLQVRDLELVPAWRQYLARTGPLPLWPVAQAGMAAGDDLHFGTNAASSALAAHLQIDGTQDWAAAIGETPVYFLALWMAACALMLKAVQGDGPGSVIVRAGGNGEQFGVSLAGNASRWSCVEALPPAGPRLAGKESFAACGAIGDSAVIDMLGFGAQRLARAPAARDAFESAGVLPADYADIARQLCATNFPDADSDQAIGLDAQHIVATGLTPLVALAMLGSDGITGLLGRGLYRPPAQVFGLALTDS